MTTEDAPPVLTLLYAGGDHEDRVRKAWASGADVVIVDLEDAVAPSRKAAARRTLGVLCAELPARPVQVRITAEGSPWHDADLDAVRALPPGVEVRVPKLESAAQVQRLAAALPERRLHLLVESALGVERAYEIAAADPAVAAIGLGEADLRGDLGVADDRALLWARSRIVVAARAAGLPSPAMSVYAHTRDLRGLAASCAEGRALGFLGRAAIHPVQLDTIRDAFVPDAEEAARARAVLARVAEAADAGEGALALPDGTFLDAAMVTGARRTVLLAERAQPAGTARPAASR